MKFLAPTAGLSLALLSASPACAGARQEARVAMATNPAELKFQQDWGDASADLVMLSGVATGVRPGKTDLRAAHARAFERIGGVLRDAGMSWRSRARSSSRLVRPGRRSRSRG